MPSHSTYDLLSITAYVDGGQTPRIPGWPAAAGHRGRWGDVLRRIIETAGGQVTLARSETGAHFVVTLPTKAEQPAATDLNAVSRS